MLRDGAPSEIERCFRQARSIARQQQARMLELRATLSLCRWWQRHGKIADAQQVLTPIVAWFTEGRASSDVQAAARLVQEMTTSDAGSRAIGERRDG